MSRPASPQCGPRGIQQANGAEQDNGRSMQVKVLYTFDETKTNCLTRCPQPLDVRTAFLDSSTQIGIVRLQTCVETVITASPELVARTGQDYTVYAHDYSEHETPLVGQGMLSSVLSMSAQTANSCQTMVTGIVRKNLFGLFSGGVSETLEVRLRFVPVPCRQSGASMGVLETYRGSQELGMESMDASAWSPFSYNNASSGLPPRQEILAHARQERPSFSADARGSNMGTPVDSSMQSFDAQPSRPNSRAGESLLDMNSLSRINERAAAANQRPNSRNAARPASRNSVRNGQRLHQPVPQMPQIHPRDMNDSIDLSSGPLRKRAQITQVDWNGPSALDVTAEPLRVKASAAALMRSRRLSMAHPTASEIASGDASLRPPTPRPDPVKVQRKLALPRSNTGLAHEVITHKTTNYSSPYQLNFEGSDGAMTSPEAPSTTSTPLDIPSSPPVMRQGSPTPSSPCLPRLRTHIDSGFVSGTLEEGLDDDIDDEMRSLDDEDMQILSRYGQRLPGGPTEHSVIEKAQNQQPGLGLSELSMIVEVPGDPSLLPRKILPRPINPRKRRATEAPDSSPRINPQRRPSKASRQAAPSLQSDIPMSDIGLPQLPVSCTVNDRSLPEPFSQDPPSDAMSTAGDEGTRAGGSRPSGSGLKRKQFIQSRLASCLAAGEMPPYCKNCGEVSTPTWRKAFARVEEGTPDILRLLEGDDAVDAWEVVEKDKDDVITSYRVFMKSVKGQDKEQFEELQLCNPCGIWLWKNKAMRPPEVWDRANTKEAEVSKKRPSRKKKTPSPAGESSVNTESEIQVLPEVLEAPTLERTEAIRPRDRGQRAASLGPDRQASSRSQLLQAQEAQAALRKAVQSSPPRAIGSKNSPIELDEELSPKPLRRLIFPSPRRAGEVKSLEHASRSPVAQTQGKDEQHAIATNGSVEDMEDKENQRPATGDEKHDGLEHLFEGDNEPQAPRTPIMGASSCAIFKTPTTGCGNRILTPNGFLSSAAKRWRDAASSPSRALDAGSLTPFTAELTRMLSQSVQSPQRGNRVDGSTMAMFSNEVTSDADFFAFSDFGADNHAFGIELGLGNDSFTLYEDPSETAKASWAMEGSLLLEGAEETTTVAST